MEKIIHLILFIPLAGFIGSLLVNEKKEKIISGIAFITIGISLILVSGFIVYWSVKRCPSLDLREMTLYRDNGYIFFLDFFFDKVTAFFLLTGSMISFLVVVYSRHYMHREAGFKRFFNTILFFYTGYTITVLAGNFETLFIGWEILGISSFLLIAFYRQRYLPVKNALKVFTIYRIGDIGILLAIWMSHHLWHENVTFFKLHNSELVHDQLSAHSGTGIFISFMILLAALAKSAQLPFSAWLPRAMEGPTPSSAIFYGSLSVHIGAFLLLRTFPFWEHQWIVRVVIGLSGIGSAIITTLIARVQSTVKGQIAYSSAAQIGIIFFEIAAGYEIIALLHFTANAFLRTYQLLTSPSVVTYLVREQSYHYVPERTKKKEKTIYKSIHHALYLISLKEWNLDSILYRLIFKPLKRMRRILAFFTVRSIIYLLLPLYLIGFFLSYTDSVLLSEIKNVLAITAGTIALLMVSKAYNERTSSRLAWLLVIFAHFFVDLAVSFNDHLDIHEATIYLGGIILSGITGYYCLMRIRSSVNHEISLDMYHGLVARYRTVAFLFLLACLGVAGFPITTTFFGEDILLTHIQENQVLLAALTSLTFIINGISVIRIYSRLFLGRTNMNYQNPTDLTI